MTHMFNLGIASFLLQKGDIRLYDRVDFWLSKYDTRNDGNQHRTIPYGMDDLWMINHNPLAKLPQLLHGQLIEMQAQLQQPVATGTTTNRYPKTDQVGLINTDVYHPQTFVTTANPAPRT